MLCVLRCSGDEVAQGSGSLTCGSLECLCDHPAGHVGGRGIKGLPAQGRVAHAGARHVQGDLQRVEGSPGSGGQQLGGMASACCVFVPIPNYRKRRVGQFRSLRLGQGPTPTTSKPQLACSRGPCDGGAGASSHTPQPPSTTMLPDSHVQTATPEFKPWDAQYILSTLTAQL